MLRCGVLCADRFPVPKMRTFVESLHSGGRRWVPIHDSAVAKVPGYSVFDEGTLSNIWIKEATGGPYIGQVMRILHSLGFHAPKTPVRHVGCIQGARDG